MAESIGDPAVRGHPQAMNGSARLLHARACDLLEAAHGIAAASTATGAEPAMPEALSRIEEALALLALSADAMRGATAGRPAARTRTRDRQDAAAAALADLATALREARGRCGTAAAALGGLAGLPSNGAAAR